MQEAGAMSKRLGRPRGARRWVFRNGKWSDKPEPIINYPYVARYDTSTAAKHSPFKAEIDRSPTDAVLRKLRESGKVKATTEDDDYKYWPSSVSGSEAYLTGQGLTSHLPGRKPKK